MLIVAGGSGKEKDFEGNKIRIFTVTLVILCLATVALIARSIRFALVFDEDRLRRIVTAAATIRNGNISDDDGVVLSLAQNSWISAQLTAAKLFGGDGASVQRGNVLFAEVFQRTSSFDSNDDGLIIFRPLEWYVYYRAHDRFYFLTNTFRSGEGRACSDNESAFLALTPGSIVDDDDDTDTTANEPLVAGCLSVGRLELLNSFLVAKRNDDDTAVGDSNRRFVVGLDNLLSDREPTDPPITLIELLNYLLDERLL